MSEGEQVIIDYSQSLFYFIGTRKHMIKDQSYHIYIFDDRIIMGQNVFDTSPKYSIHLSLSEKIGWELQSKDQKMMLQAFCFLDGSKSKIMYAKTDCLDKFKLLISCKVTFCYIADFYELQFNIGKGSSAKVFQCIKLSNEKLYAIKAIGKDYFQSCEQGMSALKNEVSILQQLTKLANIEGKYFIQLYEVYEGNLTVYLVTELMQGRTLQNEMNMHKEKKTLMPQDQVRTIMLQLLQGLSILHKCNIIHRDLKPDNIMFEKSSQYDTLKIVDFGLATRKDVEKFMYRKCGTPGYVAPEVLNLKQNKHSYSEVCDVFSCGVIFYKLLSGNSVFVGATIEEVLKKNKSCQINFYSDEINHIEKSERKLLEAMLKKDPYQRVTAEAALQFGYFTQKKIKSQTSLVKIPKPDQHRSSTPLPQPLLLLQLDQYNINSLGITDQETSPFYRMMVIKKQVRPVFFYQTTSQVDILNQDDLIKAKKIKQSSIYSIEDMETDQVIIQQIPIFKITKFNNHIQEKKQKIEQQHIYFIKDQKQQEPSAQQSLIQEQKSVTQDQSSRHRSFLNRFSIANLTSFYMKDPLSNLFKHQQILSRQYASQDNSPNQSSQQVDKLIQ